MPCAARRTLANVKSRAIRPRQPEVPNLITEVITSPGSPETSLFPVEGPLLQRVKITDEQNPEKRHHREKNHVARGLAAQHLAIHRRPWVQENHLDIEKNEQHR